MNRPPAAGGFFLFLRSNAARRRTRHENKAGRDPHGDDDTLLRSHDARPYPFSQIRNEVVQHSTAKYGTQVTIRSFFISSTNSNASNEKTPGSTQARTSRRAVEKKPLKY